MAEGDSTWGTKALQGARASSDGQAWRDRVPSSGCQLPPWPCERAGLPLVAGGLRGPRGRGSRGPTLGGAAPARSIRLQGPQSAGWGRVVGPSPASANRGKLRQRNTQPQPGSPLLPQGPRQERHSSRDPRRLNLNSSPPRGMQRWALRLRSLPWFGVGRRGGRLREACEREERGVRAGGGKQRPGPRARERQSAQRVGGGAGAPEAAPGAAEPMGGRGAGAGGGGAAIRRWRRRPLGDHWQAAVARARTLFAPEVPHGDRSAVPRPRSGAGETHGRAAAGRDLQPVRKPRRRGAG